MTYIDAGHAIPDVSARQNHTIFARRGCGKTLLLHDSTKHLPKDTRAIYLNCEDFKRHTFPNVLIEILTALFGELEGHLGGWFGRKAKTKIILQEIIARLNTMHLAPDEHEEAIKQTQSDAVTQANSVDAEISAELSAPTTGKVGSKLKAKSDDTTNNKLETERVYKTHRQKLQELDLWLPELKKRLREFFELSSKVKCIILQVDDLYHLKRTDQAFVVDYIHRLCKDLPIFFKIATIRHASTMYADREGQPIGAQERHDYQPINIDYSFSDFTRTRSQNWRILKEYGERAKMSENELDALFRGEGFSRLVMAGGGVPRDVLSLFLEGLSDSDGNALGKDDIRVLSRLNIERRIEELKKDSHADEQDVLISGIYALREFCLTKMTNVFLVPEKMLQKSDSWKSLFNRLSDYRIIHQSGSALTHKSTPGTYQAFAIDIGCYAHYRKMEGRFVEIDVSRAEAKDKMRSAPILTELELDRLLKGVPHDAESQLKQPLSEID